MKSGGVRRIPLVINAYWSTKFVADSSQREDWLTGMVGEGRKDGMLRERKKASRVAEPGRPRRSFGRNWMRSVAGGVDRASLRTGAASRRRAEERLVVAVELLRALIAHGVGRGIDVSVASQQELLRLIEAKTLLVLQGRERGEGLEVPMEGRRRMPATAARSPTGICSRKFSRSHRIAFLMR